MADAEEKAKAEKLAAAKKRVEALKKKTQKKTTKKEEKPEPTNEASKQEDPEPVKEDKPETEEPNGEQSKEAIVEEGTDDAEMISELKNSPRQQPPSLSIQSKMRSSSFRQTSASGGPLSPDHGFFPEGGTAPDIYRKQASRIEELEKENKRLAKEATEGEKRWKKAEEELEDLREAEDLPQKTTATSTPDSSAEVEKLKTERAALQRQLSQLQAQSTRGSRHGSSPSISVAPHHLPDVSAELASKSATIESMEIEISNLRARLTTPDSGQEQVAALEEKLLRTERAAATAQRELGDLKKNLERTTEKAVREGSERISAETKLRTLERESGEAQARAEELQKKVDALEKKVATLATLHKEHDARSQAQKREREKAEKEAAELRIKLGSVENENLRLRDEKEKLRKKKVDDAQGADDDDADIDGVDELEDEERQRLEKKLRELEAENHELRRGVWRERRHGSSGPTSPGARFTDVDLNANSSTSPDGRRRRSTGKGGGIGDFFTSGFNAITGGGGGGGGGNDSGLLDDDDELEDFDEEAFRIAQEEEMMKRMERVKDVKRGLKNWEGWRLDLVENRKGGGEGVGEIFEV